MLREWRGIAAGIVAGIALLGGPSRALAQTATTTTAVTTTTTTTLQPHAFGDATADCIADANGARRECRQGGGTTCRTDFETAYSKCFAEGSGVSCAKRCITRETTCFGAIPTTTKNCRKACRTARRRERRACKRIPNGDTIWAGGDAACLSTAESNLDLCRHVCSQADRDCRTALKFCIANCANL